MSRLHKVDAKKFRELKAALKTGAKKTTVANRNGVSVETLRKVKNAKTFADYQDQNKQSHRSTPSSTYTAPQPEVDKRGFWARLFNI